MCSYVSTSKDGAYVGYKLLRGSSVMIVPEENSKVFLRTTPVHATGE